jgi:hypothetical protein
MRERIPTATNKMVLRTLLLVGCSSAGQPTIEELLRMKLGSKRKGRLRATGHDCIRMELNNDKHEEIFCPRLHDPALCSTSAFGMMMMMTLQGGPNSSGFGDISSLMERPTFANPESPQQELETQTVTEDLERVFLAAGVNTERTRMIPINARMHATSFRVLFEAGVPRQIQNKRHTPDSIWEADDD